MRRHSEELSERSFERSPRDPTMPGHVGHVDAVAGELADKPYGLSRQLVLKGDEVGRAPRHDAARLHGDRFPRMTFPLHHPIEQFSGAIADELVIEPRA